jgi:hypothetical protein
MSEATAQATPLSVASAVENLLAAEAPVEDTPTQPEVVAETDEEVEVEAEPESEESEDILEADDAEEIEDDEEAVEAVEEEPVEKTYRVRVGEDEVDLTLDELQSGYMRQSDYTRKTQQVADGRKQAQAELQALGAQRQNYVQQLAAVEAALTSAEPTQEYWDALKDEDPIEFMTQREATRDRKDAMAQVKEEQERVNQEQVASLQSQMKEHLEQEGQKLLQVIPEWRNPDTAQKEKNAIYTYAQRHLGYTADELSHTGDHRAINTIRKAYLYDELMKQKPAAAKKAKKAPKMVKGGQPTSKRQLSAKRKRQQLQNIGKRKGGKAIDAAVEYLLNQ